MYGFNLSDITDAKFGNVQVSELYFGSTKIWPLYHDYSRDYFTIRSLSNYNIINYSDTTNIFEYSTNNGATWTTWGPNINVTLNNGGKLLVKGNSPSTDMNYGIGIFNASGNFNVMGNTMSLIYGDNFINQTTINANQFVSLLKGNSYLRNAQNLILPATTLASHCYQNMFYGCSSLVTAPELPATTLAFMCYTHMFQNCSSLASAPALSATTLMEACYMAMFNGCSSLTSAPALPATTLANYCYDAMFGGCSSLASAPALPATTLTQQCYHDMFNGCSSLASAPALPATTLTYGCYMSMFEGCTSLTTAPALPATTLADSCYAVMFGGCTSLTTAPELLATTLATQCYQHMFNSCSMLNYVKCLATDMTATNCTYQWLENVSASGTFVKYINTTWTTGISGIPVGWTVQNEGHDYSQEYLTFEALESGNFTWTGTNSNSIYYSIDDGSTWTQLTSGSSTPSLNANDKILFKATGISPAYFSGIGQFSSSGKFNIMGNIMSLVYGDNFINNNTLRDYQFRRLFYNCNKLVNASNLILPAPALTSSCYYAMFSGCSSLTTAPALPATTLAVYCYNSMFNGCTSLTTAPELPATTLVTQCYHAMFSGCSSLTTAPSILPATTLVTQCYSYMFSGCSSLTTAPELPATTLQQYCYYRMFYNCTKLNYVKCLATTNVNATNCDNWLYNVSTSGTFIRYANTYWPSGTSGIPSGWTVQNA